MSEDFGKNLSSDFAGARENKIHQKDMEQFEKTLWKYKGQKQNGLN